MEMASNLMTCGLKRPPVPIGLRDLRTVFQPLYETYNENDMVHIVDENTRGSNLLDLIFSNESMVFLRIDTYYTKLRLLVPGRGRIGPRTSKTLITLNHLIRTS